MRTLLTKLFRSRPRTGRTTAPPARRPRFQVEALDDRVMPSVTTSLTGTTLNVFADTRADNISFRYSPGVLGVGQAAVDDSSNGTHLVVNANLTAVKFITGGGHAQFYNASSLASSYQGSSSAESWNPGSNNLMVNRLASIDHVGIANYPSGTWVYEAESGDWYRPGGWVNSVSHSGSTFYGPYGAATLTLAQSAYSDGLISTAESPNTSAMKDLFVQDLTRDQKLTRADVDGLFRQALGDYTLTAQENQDLHTVVGAGDVPTDPAGRNLAGHTLSDFDSKQNLVGPFSTFQTTAQLMGWAEGKWFYGTAHPVTGYGTTYMAVSGTLFGPNGPQITDLHQGHVGDCYLLSALGEVANQNPQAIRDMFSYNGNGTYTVRFFRPDTHAAEYVTVDGQLPIEDDSPTPWLYHDYEFYADSTGAAWNSSGGVLWVALAEKAYAQLNEEGWINPYDHSGSYPAISGGDPGKALTEVTGKTTISYGQSASDMATAFANHAYVVAGSRSSWPSGQDVNQDGVVSDHAYAYLGRDGTTGRHILFNPWGTQQSQAPVYVSLTDAQFAADFGSGEVVSAAAGGPTGSTGPVAPPTGMPGPLDAGLPAPPAGPNTPAPVWVADSSLPPDREAEKPLSPWDAPPDGGHSGGQYGDLSWEASHAGLGVFVG